MQWLVNTTSQKQLPKALAFHIGRNCHYCLVGKVMWQQIAHVLLLLNTYPLSNTTIVLRSNTEEVTAIQ